MQISKIGVIVYNRNVCRLTAPLLERLAERCPNLIGYKDGLGDIELMVSIRRRLGDRFSYLGGLPTAEVYAAAYKALGVPVYSSAVFNFIPKTAMDFYHAVAREDHVTVGKIIDDFFLPYLDIRPFNGAVGAEIIGLDLALPVSDQDFARIHRAHLEHHVVVFRDQRSDLDGDHDVPGAEKRPDLAQYRILQGP